MAREVNGVEVRGLTRKEIKGLKEFGFHLSFFDPNPDLPASKYDEGMEKVFDLCVLNKEAFEKLDDEGLQATAKVFTAILFETYGSKVEEKNSPTSGNGRQTQNE